MSDGLSCCSGGAPSDEGVASDGTRSAAESPEPLITLVGLPNSGKTTLYNALTGSNYKTVNYPGSTVEYAISRFLVGDRMMRIMDSPGIVSLSNQTPDEEVTVDALFGRTRHGMPDAIVIVADATQLARHLYPARHLLRAGHRVVIAVTMVDILEKRKNMSIDISAISREMNCPVVRIDGRTGQGVDALRSAVIGTIAAIRPKTPEKPANPSAEQIVDDYRELERIEDAAVDASRAPAGTSKRLAICMPDPTTERLDRWLLHPVFGAVIFSGIMTAIFTAIFWLAQPMMNAVDRNVSALAVRLAGILPNVWISHLLTDGLIMGVGAVAVFIPQIVILFFALGILEDSGYLSRGAMIVDRPLAAVGLSGRGFVPILSGFACAIPAMLSTRTIPSTRERLLTIFILPLMVCSARLPVYGLLLSFLTPPNQPWIGGIGLTALYLFSVVSGLFGAFLFGKFLKLEKRVRPALLLELPAIRKPKFRVVLTSTYYRTKSYILRAGGTIVVIAIFLWVLTHFPPRPGLTESEQMSQSLAAVLGQWMEPLMRPLGLDWRVGVALICAFAAREVFVGALALVLLVTGSPNSSEPLLLAMRNATMAHGTPLFTVSSCLGLIVFFVFALQCMATVAVSRKETGGWKIPMTQLFAFTGIAYIAAFAVVQTLRATGIP